MPVSRALRRLLHVRAMEEEQQRLALESALGELHALEDALSAARARDRAGRALLNLSFQASEPIDRTAAQVEVQSAVRRAAFLKPRIAAAETAASRARQAFLDKRLERRQAQTLIEQAEARDAVEFARRGQQSLDETYGSQHHRERRSAEPRPPSRPAPRPPVEDLEQEISAEADAFRATPLESHCP